MLFHHKEKVILIYLYCFIFFFGAILGSFAHSYLYRFDENHTNAEVTIFYPRSFCPQCKNQLKSWMIIPIISYFLSFGKCSFCKKDIKFNYLSYEILFGLIAIFIYITSDAEYIAFINLCFVVLIFLQISLDLKYLVLSTSLSLIIIVLGCFKNFNSLMMITESLIGAGIGFLFLFLINYIFNVITKKNGIGSGDFYLLAGLGSFYGIYLLPFVVLIGAIVTLAMHLLGITKGKALPLGAGLGIGSYLILVTQNYF